jgi:outer membrane receptor protein involved in Fe transport
MSLSADLGPGQILVSATNLTDEYYIADDFSSTNAGVPGMPRRFLVRYRYSY